MVDVMVPSHSVDVTVPAVIVDVTVPAVTVTVEYIVVESVTLVTTGIDTVIVGSTGVGKVGAGHARVVGSTGVTNGGERVLGSGKGKLNGKEKGKERPLPPSAACMPCGAACASTKPDTAT